MMGLGFRSHSLSGVGQGTILGVSDDPWKTTLCGPGDFGLPHSLLRKKSHHICSACLDEGTKGRTRGRGALATP